MIPLDVCHPKRFRDFMVKRYTNLRLLLRSLLGAVYTMRSSAQLSTPLSARSVACLLMRCNCRRNCRRDRHPDDRADSRVDSCASCKRRLTLTTESQSLVFCARAGFTGLPGFQGPAGFVGAPGPSGFRGPSGQQGVIGVPGHTGQPGFNGSPGFPGPEGARGLVGK